MANICEKCTHRNVCRYQEPCEECNQFAEEVVRCKDCKYQIKEWHPDNRMISKGYYTYGCDRNFHRYSSNAVNGRDNEFCSHGERKDNERKDD